MLEQFFQDNLIYVIFFYGLGFIFMGVSILIQKRKCGRSTLMNAFLMLALFGIIHGLTEWMDMAKYYMGQHDIEIFDMVLWNAIRNIVFVISFMFLLQFGIEILLSSHTGHNKWLKGIPFGAGLMWIWFAVFMGLCSESTAELVARHGLGFTGGILSVSGMLLYYFKFKSLGLKGKSMVSWVMLLVAMGAYSIFGGLVITPIAGIPPQIFRTACALLAAFGSISFLSDFRIGKREQYTDEA